MERILAIILELLLPLRYLDSPQRIKALLTALGYALPEDVDPPPSPLDFKAALSQSLALAARLRTATTREEKLAALAEAVSLAQTVWKGAQDLQDALAGAFNAIPNFLSKTDFQATFPKRLLDYLIVQYLQKKAPRTESILEFLGITSATAQAENLSKFQSECTLLSLHLELIPDLIQSPSSLADDLYAWNSQFDSNLFLSRLALVMRAFGMAGNLLPDDDPNYKPDPKAPEPERLLFYPLVSGGIWPDTYWQFGLRAQAAEAQGGLKKGLAVVPYAEGQVGTSVPLDERLSLRLTVNADLEAGVGVYLRPPSALEIEGNLFSKPISSADAEISLELSDSGAGDETILLGSADQTRLSAKAFSLKGTLSVANGDNDLSLELNLPDWSLVVDPGEGDSFINSILQALPLQVGGDLLMGYSLNKGFYIDAGSGLSLDIPLNATLGPFYLSNATLSLELKGSTAFIDTTLTGSVLLGPFSLSVDAIGLSSGLDWDSPDGLLGSLDVSMQFKPPSGIGVGIDAGVVAGGGYLYIDAEAGTYNGILDLDLFAVGISAVALIDTRLPDGQWSFFLALYIEVPSIPLGFGFTLNGLGGVGGVNRSLDPEGLQAAIRSGALDSVLFPPDPIADAPAIISAMESIFPAAPGRYVFGPLLQIGWGTPTIIQATAGIVISLPDPLVISVLGTLSSVLPTPELDLVGLYLDIGGTIDQEAATLALNASLHGSHIAGFSLSGDMALRAAFGDDPSFLMALGGFHPAFEPPPGFTDLERLALSIDAGELLDVRFDCYFAISSNTLQFGAAFEMSAEVDGFGIEGGTEFDALVTLSPFALSVGLGYHVSVQAAGVDLMGIWLDAQLSGPNPWRVKGTATVTILGVDTPIALDQTIGKKTSEPAPAAEDVLGQVRAALALPEAWSLGAGGGSGVTLAADPAGSAELAVCPDGSLGVSQRVVPLGIALDRGDPWQLAGGYNTFDLEAVSPGLSSSGEIQDWFAVSSFQDLEPNEKLSAPSFEQLKSGIQFGGGEPAAGQARKGTLTYEQILHDPELAAVDVHSSLNLGSDPRAASMGQMASAQIDRGYQLTTSEQPITVSAPGYALSDALSGAALGSYPSWTASHAAARLNDNAVVRPAWEMQI